jgi:hypothetical protein
MRHNFSFGRSFNNPDNHPPAPNLGRDLNVPKCPTKEIVLEYLRPLLKECPGEIRPQSKENYNWVPEFFSHPVS